MKRVTLFEGKYKRFVCEKGWEYIESVRDSGIVVIIALNRHHKLILVEQLRIPVGKRVIELPAGLANDLRSKRRESLADAAKRELFEETGYCARKMIPLIRGPASSATNSAILTLFRAEGLIKKGSGGGDSTESIKVHEVPLEKIEPWLRQKEKSGFLIDPKIYAALYFVKP